MSDEKQSMALVYGAEMYQAIVDHAPDWPQTGLAQAALALRKCWGLDAVEKQNAGLRAAAESNRQAFRRLVRSTNEIEKAFRDEPEMKALVTRDDWGKCVAEIAAKRRTTIHAQEREILDLGSARAHHAEQVHILGASINFIVRVLRGEPEMGEISMGEKWEIRAEKVFLRQKAEIAGLTAQLEGYRRADAACVEELRDLQLLAALLDGIGVLRSDFKISSNSDPVWVLRWVGAELRRERAAHRGTMETSKAGREASEKLLDEKAAELSEARLAFKRVAQEVRAEHAKSRELETEKADHKAFLEDHVQKAVQPRAVELEEALYALKNAAMEIGEARAAAASAQTQARDVGCALVAQELKTRQAEHVASVLGDLAKQVELRLRSEIEKAHTEGAKERLERETDAAEYEQALDRESAEYEQKTAQLRESAEKAWEVAKDYRRRLDAIELSSSLRGRVLAKLEEVRAALMGEDGPSSTGEEAPADTSQPECTEAARMRNIAGKLRASGDAEAALHADAQAETLERMAPTIDDARAPLDARGTAALRDFESKTGRLVGLIDPVQMVSFGGDKAQPDDRPDATTIGGITGPFAKPKQGAASTRDELLHVLRALRDIGTGKIAHIYSGACPDVGVEGEDGANDRADPDDNCAACTVLAKADALIAEGTVEGWVAKIKNDTAESEALKHAIRVFTVEAPGEEPNGPAEAALLDLDHALDPNVFKASEGRRVLEARKAADKLTAALFVNVRGLRLAAEKYFGGNFSAAASMNDEKPEVSGEEARPKKCRICWSNPHREGCLASRTILLSTKAKEPK